MAEIIKNIFPIIKKINLLSNKFNKTNIAPIKLIKNGGYKYSLLAE